MPRITWPDLPDTVRTFVETTLGSPVTAWASQTGGYSPGTADRLTCADGTGAFLKAVSPAQNPDSPALYRREAEVMAAIPAHVPIPRLLGTYDDGDWVAVLLEDVEGRMPQQPWVRVELDAVLTALDGIHAATTPCAIPGLPRIADEVAEVTPVWDTWAAGNAPADLDPWIAQRLPELVVRRRRALDALAGDSLCHYDLRNDNVLLRPDGTAVIVDWPYASVGPRWFDAACLAIQLMGTGGPDVDEHLDAVAARHGVARETLDDLLLTLLAYQEERCRRPAPPGLPTIRVFQRDIADRILAWARTLPA